MWCRRPTVRASLYPAPFLVLSPPFNLPHSFQELDRSPCVDRWLGIWGFGDLGIQGGGDNTGTDVGEGRVPSSVGNLFNFWCRFVQTNRGFCDFWLREFSF